MLQINTLINEVSENSKKLCTKVDLVFINDTNLRELLRTSSGTME